MHRHKRLLTASAIAVLVMLGIGFAGSVSDVKATYRSMKSTLVSYTTAASGGITGTVTGIDGLIERVTLIGNAGFTNTIALNDLDGVDLINGQGADVSNVTVNVWADNADAILPIANVGAISVVVTGGPGVTNGTFRIYWR